MNLRVDCISQKTGYQQCPKQNNTHEQKYIDIQYNNKLICYTQYFAGKVFIANYLTVASYTHYILQLHVHNDHRQL